MSANIKIIPLIGILDGTKTQELRDRVDQGIAQGAETILIDLKEVTFMDSSGLGALVTALKAARSAGRKLCVCSVNEQVKILFELTSMDRVFLIFRDQAEFISKMGGIAGVRLT
jgi:anti-sigma B factor antagonist